VLCACLALVGLAVAVQGASAYTTLGVKTRRQIVRNADLPSPNGKTIRRAACIGGRLSTIDQRWAMFYLTNTKACVRRYGGASGGAGLLERTSSKSVDWTQVGEIGEQGCPHGVAGASDAVLRDLGCASFAPERWPGPAAPRLLMRSAPRITPQGVGRLRLGATVGSLRRRHLIGGLRKGCELYAGQRVAPLRSPLSGWATFEGGGRTLAAISIEGGAETASGIGAGSTAAEARAAYPAGEWLSPRRMYPLPVGLLWVDGSAHPKFGILVDPETHRVEDISIPSPNFCE
jgi:hypothetical protein